MEHGLAIDVNEVRRHLHVFPARPGRDERVPTGGVGQSRKVTAVRRKQVGVEVAQDLFGLGGAELQRPRELDHLVYC